MAKIVNLVFFLTSVTLAQSLAIVKEEQPPHYITRDHVLEMTTDESKPGSPVFEDWKQAPLFSGGEEWRGMLGERLVRALLAGDVMTFCKRLLSINDYSYCRHGMPIEQNLNEEVTKVQREYVLPVVRGPEKDAATDPKSQLGLAFGLSKPDKWSEIMSNKYGVETKLFDCNFSTVLDGAAYRTKYEVEDTCLDDSTGNHEKFTAKNNKAFQPLSVALQGREKYSVLLKLDVDGAEWATLDWLTKNMAEMDKIRSIDVRINMIKEASPDGGSVEANSQEAMTRHVEILEKLKNYFTVVGSSVEGSVRSYIQSNLAGKKFPKIKEPPIHTEGGIPLEDFYVSYLNRILL